jgi:hypothetical protein
MLHPSKKGIICDLSGNDYLIKDNKLVYHTVVINNKDKGRVLDLDIGNEALTKILANVNKPSCKMCGSNTNVNNDVEINNITVHPDHNDVDSNVTFKICDSCFSKLREQVVNVAKSNNEKIRK